MENAVDALHMAAAVLIFVFKYQCLWTSKTNISNVSRI